MRNVFIAMPLLIALGIGALSCSPGHALAAQDAQGNGSWISLGVPRFIHIGTEGPFVLNGTNEGRCAGVQPQYFLVDMNAPHWKEFFAWLLSMAALNKQINCVVESGCGTNLVSVKYCGGSLQ